MLLVAHRIPATAAACEQLAAAGARLFEADVQLDERGRVIVSHYLPFGAVLQRDNWRLRHRARAGRDPLLADVVARVPRSCGVLLDLKGADGAQLAGALGAALTEPARYRVCGGTPDDLDIARSAGLRTWRTVGTTRDLHRVLAGTGALPDEAISIRQTLLSADVVAALHRRVPRVIAWTVNHPARARQLIRFGVDGLTTDRLAVLRHAAAHG